MLDLAHLKACLEAQLAAVVEAEQALARVQALCAQPLPVERVEGVGAPIRTRRLVCARPGAASGPAIGHAELPGVWRIVHQAGTGPEILRRALSRQASERACLGAQAGACGCRMACANRSTTRAP
jgi:hypothetical protein